MTFSRIWLTHSFRRFMRETSRKWASRAHFLFWPDGNGKTAASYAARSARANPACRAARKQRPRQQAERGWIERNLFRGWDRFAQGWPLCRKQLPESWGIRYPFGQERKASSPLRRTAVQVPAGDSD